MNRQSILDRVRNSEFTFFENGDFEVNNAVLVYRNFSGNPTSFNKQGGGRTFGLVVTDEVGEYLRDLGWNVKMREPKREGDEPFQFTEIVVSYKGLYPPDIRLISTVNGMKKGKILTESNVGILDNVWIENAKLRIHPRRHDSHGYIFKGYANKVAITQARQDFFGSSYSDVDWGDDLADDEYPEE